MSEPGERPAAGAWRDTVVGAVVLAGVLGGAAAVALAIGGGRPLWGRRGARGG